VFVEAFVNTNPVACARPAIRRAQPAEIEIEKLFVITPQKCGGEALSNDHRDNHSFGDEVAWWGRRAIDPLATSRMLWVSTRRIE